MFGEGRLLDPQAPDAPLPTAYELEVYRDWTVEGGDDDRRASGSSKVTCWPTRSALAALAGRGGTFTLRMDDGRRLEVFVTDDAGRVVNVEGTTFIVP